MKKIILVIIFTLLLIYTFSQEKCNLDYFITSYDEIKLINKEQLRKAFESIDTNCIKRNAEYSEILNVYIFLCLTYQIETLFEVLSKSKCDYFYKIVLNEVAKPVADTFDFRTIYCEISTYEGENKKVRDEVLIKFKEGIIGVIKEAPEIIKADCYSNIEN